MRQKIIFSATVLVFGLFAREACAQATATPTNTPTSTPTCGILYSDDFSNSGTLSNYVVTQRETNLVSVTITGGEMVVSAPASGLGGVEILTSNAVLGSSTSNYTEEFDASIDTLNGYGDFGSAFRGSTAGDYYSFLWNGNPENNPPHCQSVDFYTTSQGYTYLGGASFGGGQASPAYTPGNWAHFKVACNGTSILCYVDVNDGTGSHLVYNFSDGTYTAGDAGFHADFLQNGNHARFKNLSIYAGVCAPTATPTNTPTCTQFTDTYGSSSSLSNYNFYVDHFGPSTAAAQSYQVSSGELQVAPSGGTVYSYAIGTNTVFNSSLGDYTVEGDFKLDTVGQGVFGVVFRCDAAVSQAYIFQWNGLNGRWEIEKQTGGYYYPGCSSSNPYTLGTWVHLKVTALGGTFNAWETPESAPGTASGVAVQIFTNVTDTVACSGTSGLTAALTSGNAGLRAYNVVAGNTLHMANFTAYNCVPTATPTLTATSTITNTPTVTLTFTSTGSITPTPTATAGPCNSSWYVNGNAAVGSNAVTVTPDLYGQGGSAWNTALLNLNSSFDMTFKVFLGSDPTGSDGMGFVLQNQGTTALGGAGGGLGFGNVNGTGISPSVDVEIDTHDNTELCDIAADHLGVDENGNLGCAYLAGPVAALPSGNTIKDGVEHTFEVIWNASTTTLTVYFDGNQRLTFTQNIVSAVFGGNPNVYWGFAGATGGNYDLQYFRPISCLPTATPTFSGANPPGSGEYFIYPAPARGDHATVSYNMAQSGQVELKVWNEKVELVTHVTDSKPAGVQTTPFSIAGFGSGVYFCVLTLSYDSGQVEKLGPKKFAIIH